MDDTFGGLDWEAILKQSLTNTFHAKSIEDAKKVAPAMVARLGEEWSYNLDVRHS